MIGAHPTIEIGSFSIKPSKTKLNIQPILRVHNFTSKVLLL